ncbi:hypothetical protein JCM10207_000689 [Rhodosporidiobolus poonsookiae]
MATLSAVIGLDRALADPQSLVSQTTRTGPEDYPALAPAARSLDADLRTAYQDALTSQQLTDKHNDTLFLERARDYVELSEQVDASTQLLSQLSSFLSTFQHDLSAVSGHISELQGRSKTIEARLHARKAVERSLHPFISSIIIPPALITTIVDTDPATHTDAWIPAVRDLDAKLGAIRGGARVESRKALDDAAETLRVAASSKILAHLVALLRPYTLSTSLSLPALHASLSRLKPLFDFLRRHAARQAHEFQKAYAATVRWYYETGFRRYVRALEKIRTREPQRQAEVIGSANSGVDSLALLNQRRQSLASPALGSSTSSAASTNLAAEQSATPAAVALDNAQLGGLGVILAHMAGDKTFKPPPESLFRSLSLVLSDNASSEYTFLASFFGHHSSLSLPPTPVASNAALAGLGLGSVSEAGGMTAEPGAVGAESESGRTVRERERARDEREKEHERERVAVEKLWRGVMEPALEYARNFTHALLDPVPPSSVALLSMIRLNDALLASLTSSSASTPVPSSAAPGVAPPSASAEARCPALEAHLNATRMQLWPVFAQSMSVHADSLRKINGSASSSGAGALGGLFGGGGGAGGVKDSVVDAVVRRYGEMFNAVVALSEVGGAGTDDAQAQDEAMVFSSLLRIRQELDKLLAHQAAKIKDPTSQRAFLRAHYDELLQALSAGMSRHPRSQAEVAHYRELARKAA